MAKTYLSHAKYIIHQKFEIKGVVDKHDIIGAIFGQSEGIIGEDLDIRELQGSGKIGRIEIEQESRNGITLGTLTIPSGSDMVETSILAATIEVVDKVGPCDAKFETVKIEDTRITKRKDIINRAKGLLGKLIAEEIPDSQEIANEVKAEVRASEIIEYGPDKLPAGPGVKDSEEIIIVEGRADVINLLKYNIKNVVAMGGSRIPNTIIELAKKKDIIAFVDGDRGGELDLKRLLQIAEIDYITRAPAGKEVEELTKKEILAALSKKMPVVQTKAGAKLPVDELELGNNSYWENKDNDLGLDIDVVEKKQEPVQTRSQVQQTYHLSQGYQQREERNQGSAGRSNIYNHISSGTNRFDRRPEKQEFKPYNNRREEFQQRSATFQREDVKVEENKVEVKSHNTDISYPKPAQPHTIEPKALTYNSEPTVVSNVDYKKELGELKNSLKARYYDKDGKPIFEGLVRDMIAHMKEKKGAETVVFDGIISKRLAELAKSRNIKTLVGVKKGKMSHIKGIELIEYEPR